MDFAKILRGSNGQQVMAHVDLDDEGDYQIVFLGYFDGVVGRLGIGFGQDESGRKRAFTALEKAETSTADTLIAQMQKLLGDQSDGDSPT